MIKSQYYNFKADESMQIYFQEDPRLQEFSEFHDSLEIIMITQGEAEAYIGETCSVISEGDIFFVDSYESHKYKQLSESLKAYVIVVSREYTRAFRELYPDCSFPAYMTDKAKNKEIYDFVKTWLNGVNKSYLYNIGCTSVLFSLLAEHYHPQKKKEPNSDILIKDLIKYIHTHFLEDVTLKDIAHHFGYTVEYCSKTLKKAIKCNFREYVNMLRLRKVNELVNDKSLNLTQNEILYSCGFSSPATYYRVKKQFEQEGL